VIFDDRFYSVAELADVTGYHRDSIYRAIEAGTLPAAKPRGKWLIAGPAIDAWLDTGRPRTPEPPVSSKSIRRPSENATQAGSREPRPSFRELARQRRAA
jgi:excisionase family DNA binding protein